MQGYYAPDTDFYYEHHSPGAENHIEVDFRPSRDHKFNIETRQWYIPLETVIQNLNKNCDKHLESVVLQKGFTYGEHMIRCDSVSQQKITEFLTNIAVGIDPFPIVIRTIENVNITFTDVTEFKSFAEMMMNFVNQKIQEKWSIKDSIMASQTIEEAQMIYDNYIIEE